MKKPPARPKEPRRRSDHDKRRLHLNPSPTALSALAQKATYEGYSKHKLHPAAYGLPPYTGKPRSDAMMCDRDAQFTRADFGKVPGLLRRGIMAGLVGHLWGPVAPTILWSVSDEGQIFECRITNPAQAVYHGYPARRGDVITGEVYKRFATWTEKHGSTSDKNAAERCKTLYRFG